MTGRLTPRAAVTRAPGRRVLAARGPHAGAHLAAPGIHSYWLSLLDYVHKNLTVTNTLDSL